jgi:hypothetical protein
MAGLPLSGIDEVSRRSVLQTIWTASAAALVMAPATIRSAVAQGRVPKPQAQYQDHPKDGQHCSLCINFVAPSSCRIVEGEISPDGWCQFFAAKSSG